MKVWGFVLSALLVFATSGLLIAADDKPESKEDKKEEKKPADAKVKLTKPWSELTSLTDDQKKQIDGIHDAATAEIKKIRDKEETDIMALLTDPQKTELKEVKAKDAAERKEKADKKKDKHEEKHEGDKEKQ